MTAPDRPLTRYETVKRHIAAGIADGLYPPGAKLPSENALVARLDVSRMTVNRALRELARDGVITRVQGVGSFVARPGAGASMVEIQDIRETIAARGGRHACRPVAAETAPVRGEAAVLLDLPDGTPVHCVTLVHDEDGRPLQLEQRLVRRDFAPDLLAVDFRAISVFAYLQSIAPVSELEHVAEAALPTAAEARLLALDAGMPVMRLRRRTWVGDRVVTLSWFTHPGERYRVSVRLRPADFGTER
jgi:GntR family histidine utilization transcriptional repressor